MKVKELIEILENVDGDAIVLKSQHFGNFDTITNVKETKTWVHDRPEGSMCGKYACAHYECEEDIPSKTMDAIVLNP